MQVGLQIVCVPMISMSPQIRVEEAEVDATIRQIYAEGIKYVDPQLSWQEHHISPAMIKEVTLLTGNPAAVPSPGVTVKIGF